MRKQVIAWLLLATFFGLTMPTLYTVQAHQHIIDGADLSYTQHLSISPYKAWYCECHHEVWEGDPGDSMVGLSLQADYLSQQDPRFNWAQWDFEKQWGGGDVNSYPGLSVDACVNGYDNHWYNCYNDPTWGQPPLAWYNCWYVYLLAGGYFNPVNSVEGKCVAVFYHPSHPPGYPNLGAYWWIEAYTQNPPGQGGNGWSFLTAHEP